MKTKILLHLSLALAALLPASFARATGADDESDRSGAVRVDVVVDMTEAGHKIAHPTPEHPVYYLPLSVGYKEFGYAHNFQRPPPNVWDVEHALAKALYREGYQLMTRQGHPSLVLVFWWGYMAPEMVDMSAGLQATAPGRMPNFDLSSETIPGHGGGPDGAHPTNSLGGSYGSQGAGLDSDTSFISTNWTIGFAGASDPLMSSLVAGNTINDHQKFRDPRLEAVEQLKTEPRYYVLVSAFDFQSWLHHQPVLLWRAHVSTEQWGHYFDQVVGTLITTAAPLFGRETKVPHFINAPTLPVGRVIVGAPEVKDYPTAP